MKATVLKTDVLAYYIDSSECVIGIADRNDGEFEEVTSFRQSERAD